MIHVRTCLDELRLLLFSVSPLQGSSHGYLAHTLTLPGKYDNYNFRIGARSTTDVGLSAKTHQEVIMRKISLAVAVLLVVGLFAVTDSFAQKGMKWKGSGGWGAGSQYSRLYDTKTIPHSCLS